MPDSAPGVSKFPYVSQWLVSSGFTSWQARCLTIMFDARGLSLSKRLEQMERELNPDAIEPIDVPAPQEEPS